MAQIEIILPAMGEGIIEAEITRWLVREGDHVEVDTPVVEVATDKVDSEIPSPETGILQKILSVEGDVPKIGQVLALISTGKEGEAFSPEAPDRKDSEIPAATDSWQLPEKSDQQRESEQKAATSRVFETPNLSRYAFLSPVIRKMARDHRVSPTELEKISGTGLGGRITRTDLLQYLENGESEKKPVPFRKESTVVKKTENNRETSPEKDTGVKNNVISREQIYGSGDSSIEEMDRMRRLIADVLEDCICDRIVDERYALEFVENCYRETEKRVFGS